MIDVPWAPFYDAGADAALCRGGPIAEPEDPRCVLEHTLGVAGKMRRFEGSHTARPSADTRLSDAND